MQNKTGLNQDCYCAFYRMKITSSLLHNGKDVKNMTSKEHVSNKSSPTRHEKQRNHQKPTKTTRRMHTCACFLLLRMSLIFNKVVPATSFDQLLAVSSLGKKCFFVNSHFALGCSYSTNKDLSFTIFSFLPTTMPLKNNSSMTNSRWALVMRLI